MTFKDLKLRFSSTKRIDKKTYHTRTTSKFRVKYTQWEVLLSKQVNYNQVVVKCQILQKCFLQNFYMQKFQNMEYSNSRTFHGLSRTSQGPYEPCVSVKLCTAVLSVGVGG